MKIVVVNNYKEEEKGKQALDNLTRCTGQQLEMVDYKTRQLTNVVADKKPDTVILTGSNFMLSKSDTQIVFREEMDLVKELAAPILGICFGHQLIGAAYGVKVRDLGRTVRALKDIKLVERDPVFDGLPDVIRVSESHRQAIANLPSEFRLLAESPTSRIESIVHKNRPIYGVQFHPERSDDKNPHGRTIIQNFLKIAKR